MQNFKTTQFETPAAAKFILSETKGNESCIMKVYGYQSVAIAKKSNEGRREEIKRTKGTRTYISPASITKTVAKFMVDSHISKLYHPWIPGI